MKIFPPLAGHPVDDPETLLRWLDKVMTLLESFFNWQTWTPTDGSGAGLGLTITNANYARIGNMVFVRAQIVYPVTGSGVNATIGSLPYTVLNYSNGSANSGSATAIGSCQFQAGTKTLIFQAPALGTVITNAQISNTTVTFTGFYFI